MSNPTDTSDRHHEPGSPGAESTAFVSNDDLLRFVDGAMGDDGRVRVLTHLATRPAAVERVEAYLHQNARLRTLSEHLPLSDSATFEAPLQAALVARLMRERTRRSWRSWGAAAALALAVAGGTIGLALEPWQDQTATLRQTPVPAAMPQAFFLFDKPELAALTPVVVSDAPVASNSAATAMPVDDAAAFDWLARQISDFSLKAPDFARIGLRLVGGETLDRQGTPAIRLVYQDEVGKPVVLHVGIGKADAEHAFWLVREGYVSLQWRRGPMVFAIVAPTDSPQLSHVVDLVGASVAQLPEPERNETSIQGDAVTGEGGPLQSIAVPVGPLPPASSQPTQPAQPSNRPPAEILSEVQQQTNLPEPL